MLAKHEASCEKSTPEERAKKKAQRASYQRFYAAAHANGNSRERYRESMRVPSNRKGGSFSKTACRYCHDEISENALARHEKVCQKATPKERAKRLQFRTWRRNTPTRQPNYVIPAPKQPRGPYTKHNVFANGNGRRLSATISIDFKSFREVLLQLAPMLSIDKVEVL
jgi:hypothetical protein